MDKQQAFQSYIDYLYSPSTNKSYDYIGRYIKIVKRFLDSEYPVSMTGYKQYMRKNAILVIDDPLTKEALCDFLWTIGKNTSRKRRMETVKPLEKLSKISERNKKLINDFIYYLTQEEDYSSHTLDYIHTYDMSVEEIERWEKAHNSIAMIGEFGETIEICPSYSYSVDENHKPIAGTEKPVLVISACTEDAEEEFMFSMSDKDRIKRLRDYLNDYLEGRITHNIPFHVI